MGVVDNIVSRWEPVGGSGPGLNPLRCRDSIQTAHRAFFTTGEVTSTATSPAGRVATSTGSIPSCIWRRRWPTPGAGHDRSDGPPGDTHGLGHCGLRGVGDEPGDLVVECPDVADTMTGPGNVGDGRTLDGTVHPGRLGLRVALDGTRGRALAIVGAVRSGHSRQSAPRIDRSGAWLRAHPGPARPLPPGPHRSPRPRSPSPCRHRRPAATRRHRATPVRLSLPQIPERTAVPPPVYVLHVPMDLTGEQLKSGYERPRSLPTAPPTRYLRPAGSERLS